ncbi:hypothetical protein D3C84_980760 [compost metagenome]
MHAIGMFIQVAGKNQLVGLGLLDQYVQLGADFLRAAHHRQSQEIMHRFFLMGQPQAIHGFHRWTLDQALTTHQREDALVNRCCQILGLLVGVSRYQRNAKHHVGLVQYR